MTLTLTLTLTQVTFSARVEHEPAVQREREMRRAELEGRQAQLATLVTQETELAKSEEALALRLWEVQETRRRHAALKEQLEAAIAAAEDALAVPPAVGLASPARTGQP